MSSPLDRSLTVFDNLGADPAPIALESALGTLTDDLRATNGELTNSQLEIARHTMIGNLSDAGIKSPTRLVDAAISDAKGTPGSGDAEPEKYADPEPWPDPVDGDELVGEVVDLIAPYLYMAPEKLDAIAGWAIATFFVDEVYCAPILAVLAPTREAGKTRVLDLVAPLVRRPHTTSGPGITVATMFRLQDKYRPTILIDEAERLGDHRGHSDLIQLMNDGWTRGGLVTRCVGDDNEVRFFDAFGFRAIAAIGTVADTVMSRSIPIRMQRAPKSAHLKRLYRRAYDEQAAEIARRIFRWAQDNIDRVVEAERNAPRPDWLGDRDCDNWALLFAIGQVASDHWRDRMLHAARSIKSEEKEPDWTEQIVHDVRRVFADRGWPEAIKSGDLVEALKALPDAPWTDMRRGQGLSTHGLSRKLTTFEVRPSQARDSDGTTIRGYWLADLQPVFDRYPPIGPADVVQVGQVVQRSNGAGPTHPPSGTPYQSEVGHER